MNPHFQLLEKARSELSALDRKIVFVGGATISLHIDDPASQGVRVTRDVDLVVELSGRPEYYSLEEDLRANGFVQQMLDDSPICRWSKDDLLVDVMPTAPELVGFDSSRWFERGFRNAPTYELPSGATIEAFDAVHLMAAKIEAFRDRGDCDWLASRDFEDIATVLDGRKDVFDELSADSEPARFVRHWLLDQGDRLIHRLAGHVGGPDRAAYIVDQLGNAAA